jgi:hypothetical protein
MHHPLRTPARLAIAGLYAMAVLGVVRAATVPLSWTPQQAPGFLTALTILLILGDSYTAVVFIVWLYKARENLDLSGETGMRWAKGWTVGGWFIPVANFVIPARVVGEVVARSRPGAIRSWTMPRVVIWWWIAFLLSFLRFTYQTVDVQTRTIVVHGDQFWNGVNGVASVIAAVLAVRLIREVTQWQSQWQPAGV